MDVYCPNCENECSDQAGACPKCGHPLANPLEGSLGREVIPLTKLVRVLGGLLAVLGLGGGVVMMVVPGAAGIEWAFLGFLGVWAGSLTIVFARMLDHVEGMRRYFASKK